MSEANFQARVQPWLMECFGPMIAGDREERNHRFFEESAELVQAFGMSASEAHQLVDYVWNRPVGEKNQEVGGVMVTLAALCLANELDMHAAAETELARVWTKVEAIRAKQAAKPKHSPLPQAVEPHTDDYAVDTFARVMKDKLAESREKGRGGWETCPPADLSRMLREHVEKGDPRDIANLAMMLWHLKASIAPQSASKPAALQGFAIKHIEGHGWIIDPPSGSRWIAYEGTPAGELIQAIAASPAAPAQSGEPVAQWQSRVILDGGRRDQWINIDAEGAETLLRYYRDKYEVRALYAAPQTAQTAPECQACGDGITAHDPGVCGNCFAMKYRDKQSSQTERALTKEIIGAAWRECGAHSNSPPDWALQFAQNIARALTVAQPTKQRLPISTAPRDGSTIILFFGEDTVTQGRYLPVAHEPRHPWQFIDSQGEGNWFANRSTDDDLGPSHWMPMPGDEA